MTGVNKVFLCLVTVSDCHKKSPIEKKVEVVLPDNFERSDRFYIRRCLRAAKFTDSQIERGKIISVTKIKEVKGH